MTTKDEALKLALEAAYLAGFNDSAEGYNGEYPFRDYGGTPIKDRLWVARRDEYIREALAEQPAQQQEPSMAYKVKMCPRQECASAAKCMSVACSSRAYIKPEQPAQQHIEYCLWARNGHTPCPHVQPAQRQEPVAVVNGVYASRIEWKCTPKFFPADGTNLYTTPPQRKPLTDEEISRIWGSYFSRGFEFARAIEAAHGIKE